MTTSQKRSARISKCRNRKHAGPSPNFERDCIANFLEYPVSLKRAKEAGYVVTCRDLPALVTQGDDRNDALVQAADAMDVVFATLMKQGKPFPVPSKPRRSEHVVCPPAETVAKAALYSALREAVVYPP